METRLFIFNIMKNLFDSTYTGLVMAGGQSKRMGQDKALSRFENGHTLLDIACEKIAKLTPVWHVSCAKNKNRPGYPCLEDDVENFGPIAGIVKGLEHARDNGFSSTLVLACDLPLIRKDLLLILMLRHKVAKQRPLLTVYQNPHNRVLEMLAAVYDVASLPLFYDAIKGRQRKLNIVIPGKFQFHIPWLPADEACFLNCNRPKDMERAAQYLKSCENKQ